MYCPGCQFQVSTLKNRMQTVIADQQIVDVADYAFGRVHAMADHGLDAAQMRIANGLRAWRNAVCSQTGGSSPMPALASIWAIVRAMRPVDDRGRRFSSSGWARTMR